MLVFQLMDRGKLVAGQLEMEWWRLFLLILGKFSKSFSYPICVYCEQKKREQKEGKISKRDFLSSFDSHEVDCYLNHGGVNRFVINLAFVVKREGKHWKG